jgi:NitT/TauT family transport system substrate-binding protein
MNSRSSFRGVLALAAVALWLAGGAAAAAAADKLSVRLNWIPGAEHGFFYLGKEKGWYQAEGIDLEIVAGQGSTVSVKTVGNGDNDFALADGTSIARGWEAGVPLVATAVLLKESPMAVYSKKAVGITTLKDLCGKRIGINIKSTTVAQYQAMVRVADLKDCKIEEIPVNGNGSKELLADLVDAALAYTYEDPILLTVKGIPVNEIVASNFFKLYSMALITNKAMIASKRPLADRFVAVTVKAIRYSIAHPDEGIEAFLKASPEANVEYERAKGPVFDKLVAGDDPAKAGEHDLNGWDTSIDTLVKLGMIKAKFDMADKFVPLPK